jgi:hypothetical protein
MMKHKVGCKVALIGILITAFALTGFGTAATYDSMKSYEELLRSQTTLIGSFENLLKNSTLQDTDYNYHYKFLDSFDDLADREQQGLSSFEDLVSYNWSTLSETEKISLSQSFEDLIRRESTILSSNEALLKRGFCALNSTQQKELLDRFEARLKYEVVLYTKFEDWLHFQQMIEENQTEKPAWIGFLNSYEDLIRRQANLLSSFEMLLKIRCDGRYLTLTKSILSQDGNDVIYRYHIIVTNQTSNITVTDSTLGVVKTYRLVPAGFDEEFDSAQVTLACGDCDNCTCKVCNFATVCGEVVTPNGNFTTCSVSNQYCVTVNDYPNTIHPVVYPGFKVEDSNGGKAANSAAAENSSLAANLPGDAPCPTCPRH